jgi:hypothetical protein
MSAPLAEVYQFRVWIRAISPQIWRRLLVRSDSTIADLHATLQIAFGWTDDHLHRFLIRGKPYGIWKPGGIAFDDNPRQVQLRQFHFRLKERFVYEYDLCDFWQHELRLEQILPLDSQKVYPCCIGGARQAPPEGCGGPWAFLELREEHALWKVSERFLEILEAGDLESHLSEVRQLASWLLVDHFDRRTVNRRLRQFAQTGQWPEDSYL